MIFIPLLLWSVAAVTGPARADNGTALHLDCSNAFDGVMFCDFDAGNCAEHKLSLRSNDGFGTLNCTPTWCVSGRCCCSIKTYLVLGETYKATVWRGGRRVASRNIDVTQSLKPKTPTIISVEEVNGKFQVKWATNMQTFLDDTLNANVTYHKKGDTNEVVVFISPPIVEGYSVFEIHAKHLEPSTTYVVSVKTFCELSHKFSESSPPMEFTTSASYSLVAWALILGLSLAAVLTSAAIFVCYAKLKTTWLDSVAKCPAPHLTVTKSIERAYMKPELFIPSPVRVEAYDPIDVSSWSQALLTGTSVDPSQQSSGIGSSLSFTSYSNIKPPAKMFPTVRPVSPLGSPSALTLTTHGPAGNDHSSSSSFNNKTYSLLIPSSSPLVSTDHYEGHTKAGMVCDWAYSPSTGEIAVTGSPQQAASGLLPHLPPAGPSLITDMSYQPCGADLGQSSIAEDSGLSCVSSDVQPEVGFEAGSFADRLGGETKQNGRSLVVRACDMSPFFGFVSPGAPSCPLVDDSYQAFQQVVG